MPSLPQSRKYSSPKVHVSIIICEFGYMSATGSERGGAGKPNLPRQLLIRHTTCSTLLTLICRVVARSVCRCRLTVFGDCVCGEWSWKKKKDNPKISLLLALCRNISEPAPPNIKMGSTRVHNIWPHLLAIASSSRRHAVMSKASPTRLFLGSSCAKVTAAPSGVTFASYQQCKMSWFRASFVLNGPTKKACY